MKTYRIEKISDLLAVPPDRRAACLKEIELVLDVCDLALGSGEAGPLGPIEWTDDGDSSVALHDQAGDEWLRLDVSVATQAKEQ